MNMLLNFQSLYLKQTNLHPYMGTFEMELGQTN